jgi:hypothetical protein
MDVMNTQIWDELKHHYADLIVMPTRPGEVLQSANSAV